MGCQPGGNSIYLGASITYHLVETGRIFEAVSYFNQRAFFVILGGSDVVQLGCQFLYVASEMLYCLQPVPKVAKKGKRFLKFLFKPGKKTKNNGLKRLFNRYKYTAQQHQSTGFYQR